MQPTRLFGKGGAAIFKPASPPAMQDAASTQNRFYEKNMLPIFGKLRNN